MCSCGVGFAFELTFLLTSMDFLHVLQVLGLLTQSAVGFALENSVVVAVGGHNPAGGGLFDTHLTCSLGN